ncbi:MAG: DNA polymerase III subunit alpha [Fimbriimonadaceae bacterium]|nr:DNA polymerase III subunit alpha [Fimbriimonadaceae bacterium]
MSADFVHLRATSCYAFLRGAGHPEAYAERAAELGYSALALTEEDYLCGLRRFEGACQAVGLRPLLGATLSTTAGPLSFLCRDREGYRKLCRLLSAMHLAAAPTAAEADDEDPLLPPLSIRGGRPATWDDLAELAGDHLLVLTGGRRGRLAERLRQRDEDGAAAWLRQLLERFGRRQVVVELHRLGCPGDHTLTLRQAALASRLGLRYAATNDVRYVRREQFPVYDILCCTRVLQTVDTPFAGRPVNDLQHLASPAAMQRRFADLPAALSNTVELAAECATLQLGRDRFVPCYNGLPPAEQAVYLSRLVSDGVLERYPREQWRAVFERVKEELRIIRALHLEGYFLLVWDVCRWARAQGIRCAGRGSAAGSVVCYALRITNVDAHRREITLARFLNEQRTESLPDIDVDFDRAGRDKVIDYLVARYGADHVAMTGTYMRYHARSAIRDVGRALALPPEDVDRLAKSLPRLGCDQVDGAEIKYPDVRHSPWAEARFARLRDLLPALSGIPRHLGTHLGGVIITPEPLADLLPVQRAGKPYRVIQGDKEDVEDRLVKFDCLCLPMFSVIEDANRFVKQHTPQFEVFDVPLDDAATFARLRRSETMGAFEVGSPAQRALHARLHCDDFEPLVAALALIRPGPIKGNMVERYLARRQGHEAVEYWLPDLEPVLRKTYGVLVYQEQVIEVARIAAGLSAAEADILRRSISHYRSEEAMTKLGANFCAKAVAHGLSEATATQIFQAVRGFAGYGFCESHAAAFADTAYRSVYLIEHHPAEYFAGLLRHQPMGFYPPHTLVNLVRRRGIRVVGPALNSGPARTTAQEGAIHIGLAQIKRILPETAERIVETRPHHSLGDLLRATRLPKDRVASLIRAGACDELSDHRRMLLWQLQELPHTPPDPQWHLDLPPCDPPPDPRLPRFNEWDLLAGEWDALGFPLSSHPLESLRPTLLARGVSPIATFAGAPPRTRFRLAGLVLRPHRPPTRTGRNTLFFDLEDETGVVSVTCFKDVYQRDGHHVLRHPVVQVDGAVDERTGLSLIASRVQPISEPRTLASPHARTLY